MSQDKKDCSVALGLGEVLVGEPRLTSYKSTSYKSISVLTRRRNIFSVVVWKAEDLRDDEAVLVLHARRVLFQRRRLGPRGLQEQPAGKGNGFRGTFHICI